MFGRKLRKRVEKLEEFVEEKKRKELLKRFEDNGCHTGQFYGVHLGSNYYAVHTDTNYNIFFDDNSILDAKNKMATYIEGYKSKNKKKK